MLSSQLVHSLRVRGNVTLCCSGGCHDSNIERESTTTAMKLVGGADGAANQ